MDQLLEDRAPRATPALDTDAARRLVRFINWIFGTIGYVEIRSSGFDRQIGTRYGSEIGQLTDLGFRYLCSYGETFSLFRLALLLPAITAWGMWRDRETLSLYRGTQLLAGYPVLVSQDQTAYANPNGHGVKFLTPFHDGTLLLSGTYDDPTFRSPTVRKHCHAAGIRETWEGHQSRIRTLESEGRWVKSEASFESWVVLSRQETAAW